MMGVYSREKTQTVKGCAVYPLNRNVALRFVPIQANRRVDRRRGLRVGQQTEASSLAAPIRQECRDQFRRHLSHLGLTTRLLTPAGTSSITRIFTGVELALPPVCQTSTASTTKLPVG